MSLTTSRPVPQDYDPLALRDVAARQKQKAVPERVALDKFPIYADDPLRDAHVALDDYLREAGKGHREVKPKTLAAGRAILESPAEQRLEVVRALLARVLFRWTHCVSVEKDPVLPGHEMWKYGDGDSQRAALIPLAAALLKAGVDLPEDALLEWIDGVTTGGQVGGDVDDYLPIRALVDTAARHAAANGGLSGDLTAAFRKLRDWYRAEYMDYGREAQQMRRDLDALLGEAPPDANRLLDSGEPWAESVLQTLADPNQAKSWEPLLRHCAKSDASKPTGKWLKEAKALTEKIGTDAFSRCAGEWLTLAVRPRTKPLTRDQAAYAWRAGYDTYGDRNEPVLKGLAWACAAAGDDGLTDALGALAESSYKKIPNFGPRSPAVGNACLIALIALPGRAPRAELSRLKAKVKQPTGRKMIEKALGASAAAAGMTPDDLEELAVGKYGLTEVGRGERKVGKYTAELRIAAGTKADLTFTDAKGKSRASVPAELKSDAAAKELEQTCKDLGKMLSALRDRIERMPMNRRELPVGPWRERYLDHPVVGTLARRLIWEFGPTTAAAAIGEDLAKKKTATAKTAKAAKSAAKSKAPVVAARQAVRTGIFLGGKLVDVAGRPLPGLDADGLAARLWHPIDSPAADVLAWREFLQKHEITQPFKQAYREVYLLTDAERKTRTYSNRFAAHLLRQHQFAALCTQRGWRYRLIGSWDGGGDNVPTLRLARWGLRAEFWIDYGDGDESDSGVARHVSTDQVRFYEGDATKPMPIEKVPALAFSEVMRDVDLFVGVASVGNDPNWVPPGERVGNYWQQFSFGELSQTAGTRRAVLEHLVPRLKIRDRASLDGRFLVVRGKLRTYKIHLGSGNILMEPNDQYLCIVPSRGDRDARAADGVFLPFEGDQTLSVILSKAFLLADDDKITDETITRQINGK